jgi:hypothetical protein
MKIIAATSRIGIHLLLDRATYTSRKHDMWSIHSTNSFDHSCWGVVRFWYSWTYADHDWQLMYCVPPAFSEDQTWGCWKSSPASMVFSFQVLSEESQVWADIKPPSSQETRMKYAKRGDKTKSEKRETSIPQAFVWLLLRLLFAYSPMQSFLLPLPQSFKQRSASVSIW